MIFSKRLIKQKGINHGFFNRTGGKSSGIYKSLNCGIGSNDKKSKIKKNLQIVRNKITKENINIFLVRQIHSDKIVFVKKKFRFNKKRLEADAIITDQKKIPIAILTADCVPILLYEKKRNMIAAVHAGWKGAYKGIIKKVINFMVSKGCNKKHMIAVIGPCIQEKSYSVKEDLLKKFLKKDKKYKFFFKNRKKKLFFDLPNFVKSQLKLNKITNIEAIKIDTFDKKNNFFSARRSLKDNHNDYGRNISIIMIK